MGKRYLSFLLALVMALITPLGSIPHLVFAEEGDQWAAGITAEAAVTEKRAIWMDTSAAIDERVEALLSVMTLNEKAAQMVQPEQNGGVTPKFVKDLGIGSILSGGGSAPSTGNSAGDWANRINEYKAAALQSRLGIPLIYGVDAVHGHNNVKDAVVFPHNIGLGASRDTDLAQAVGAASAEEVRATGIQWTFAPMLGVVYSERWGRFYESFGERSELVSAMGAAIVKGFQGTDDEVFAPNKVAATAKHYIGEGQTKNGINQGNVDMTDEEFDLLMVTDGLLEPYKAAIEAGARTIMASFTSVGGVKLHGHKHLLTDVLKGEASETNPLGLGFTGFIVSDWNGIQQLPQPTYDGKVVASLDAGIDMFMEPNDWQKFINAVIKGYNDGTITAERIDDAVSRILRVKFEMGLFEEEVAGDYEQELLANFGSTEHRDIARKAVGESLTVLKNEVVGATGQTALELLQESENILIAGHKANDIGAQCGGWTITWQGKLDADNAGKKITNGTTIYEGFKEAAKEGTTVSYSLRGKVTGQDAVVVVVGESPYAEGDGDRPVTGLTLSDTDINVIKTAVNSAGDASLILVLLTGRPLAIADFIDDFDAVVEAWLPGTEGAGIADVMLDDSQDFVGTLPVTWPWYPEYLTEKFTDESKVLFPFGTGLKKDGTSIVDGGQTEIPTRIDPPAVEKLVTRNGGIDISYYNGKLEGELCNPTSGTFGSYNISTDTEDYEGGQVGFVEWNSRDWGNAKWIAYFRQPGIYNVTARMKVTQSSGAEFKFGISTAVTGDGVTNKTINTAVTNGYVDVVIGQITVAASGLQGVKIMEGYGNGTATAKIKLDYLQFDLLEATGEYDDSQDEIPDDRPVTSKGAIISSDAVDVYMTSTEKAGNNAWYKNPFFMENQLTKKDSLDITGIDDQNITTIVIDPDIEYQKILGFGSSLEESTINNLSQLAPSVQDEFLRKLVDPAQGAMTLFRITIGTSDFTSKPFYTYYDAKQLTAENALDSNQDGIFEPDWYNTTGKGFSIQKDIDYKVVDTIQKVIKLAKEYGVEDEVKFFASSWTPPGWMKSETASSNSYANNDLLIKGGSLKDDRIDDLALYYTRYLEEYAKLGIDIYAMTLQNEPMLQINYPSCAITGEQEGKIAIAIKTAVNNSSILNDRQKQVKLWAFDHNPGDAYTYVSKILSVPGANDALDGIAFHDYGGSLTNMQTVLDTLLNQGDKKDQTVNLTERSVWGTTGANSIITYLRNSAISYNSWVTMLDSNIGVHQWLGTPDPTMFARAAGSDNDYWEMPEFYITGQFSRFIRPGHVRVDSNLGSTSTVTNVVFKNPETGELTAVVVNASSSSQNFKFVCNGTQIIGSVPAGNIATYVWSSPTKIIDNIDQGFDADEYAEASEGVKVSDDGSITMESEDDYVDYIVNVKEAGSYHITFLQQAAEEGIQTISVYQGEELLNTVNTAKTWDDTPVNVQGFIVIDKPGIQQIRIKMSAVNLFKIKLEKTVDIHRVPGEILANEYIGFDGICTVENGTELGNMSMWSTIFYKILVPADDTYEITVNAAMENADGPCGFVVNLDGTAEENELLKMVNNVLGSTGGFNVSGSWTEFVPTTGKISLPEGEHIIGIKIANPMNISSISIGPSIEVIIPELTEIKVALPNKLVYQIGDTLDLSGMVVTAFYDDESQEVITEGYVVSGFDSQVAGVKTIVVSYGEKQATFAVTVEARTSSSSVKPNTVSKNTTTPITYKSSAGDPSGWRQDSKGWWLDTGNGTFAKNEWKLISERWFFFEASGYMSVGWKQLNNNNWYYLKSDGAMATGWILIDQKWYYLNPDGAMKTGWLQWKNDWYYLGSNGAMIVNNVTPDGYHVNAEGVWIK